LYKCSSRDRQTPCHHRDGLPLNHHLELCAEWKNMKISEGLSNSKNMVFNTKKLINNGVDLTLWRRGEKKRYGRHEGQILRI
jgi:hypothetical protein